MFDLGSKVVIVGPKAEKEKHYLSPSVFVTFTNNMKERLGDIAVITDVVESSLETRYYLDNMVDVYVQEWLAPYTEKKKDLHVLGAKDDNGKPPVSLVFESFPRALIEIAKVAGHGEKKYTRGGWKHVPNALLRYADAGARHELNKFIDGPIDPDSGHLHLAHQAWNVLAQLELTLMEQDNG